MTIEQRLLHDCGETDDPMMAVWMLRDGTLVNGSYEGYQRDIDHHEIGAYFKRSKFEDPGSNYLYILKFMRRGNIRMSGSNCDLCFELVGPPSQAQWTAIQRCALMARRAGLPMFIERCTGPYQHRGQTFADFAAYISRYTNLNTAVCPSLLDE